MLGISILREHHSWVRRRQDNSGTGHPVAYKTTKEDTGGAYSLLEAVVAGDGPSQHIHKAEEGAFYILEGEVNVKIGERTVKATVGSRTFIPRGTVNTFWNAGPTPAKLLGIFSPAGFEQYFVEVIGYGEIDTATFVERGMAVAQKYDLEIVGPLLE